MLAQGPVSTALLHYIEEKKGDYDAFVFFTYLYATTYFGLPLVRDKAYLAPLAHDEWTIYFPMWDRFFSLPKAFLFNTDTERAFLRERFPELRLEGEVVGVGIEAPDNIQPKAFVERYGLREPFLLYVGRIDEAKGCGQMLEWFVRYRARSETTVKLVLIGRDVMPVPFHDDIIHLGFVTDEERWAAMAACDWLMLPSVNESLSMVLLEAWAAGRPAIVNGRCAVLVEHCRRSHGGIWYEDERQLEAALRNIDNPIKDKLGRQGKSYVAANYSWEKIEAAYLKIVDPSVDFQLECAVSGR
jgi:glycosyltransferase involved in cell wall biosynthesis